MYRPAAFAEDDVETIVALARTAGFGHLVVHGPDGLTSTPMPFVITDDGQRVRAHLARPNGTWRLAPCRALLIVPVAGSYVSPSWYPSKAEHAKVVPTWNYEVVHAHGELVVHDDPAWVRGHVAELTDLNESRLDRPWSVTDAPDAYLAQLARGIVGVELLVERLEGKRKLSQNKPESDRRGAIAGLETAGGRGGAGIAAAMRTKEQGAT